MRKHIGDTHGDLRTKEYLSPLCFRRAHQWLKTHIVLSYELLPLHALYAPEGHWPQLRAKSEKVRVKLAASFQHWILFLILTPLPSLTGTPTFCCCLHLSLLPVPESSNVPCCCEQTFTK